MVSFAKVRVLFSLSLLASVLASFSMGGVFYSKESLSCGNCTTEENQNLHRVEIMSSLNYYLKNNEL